MKFLIFFLLFATPLYAKNLELDAKEISFDKKGRIIAKDQVNAKYFEHNLQSDYLSYDKKNDIIEAKGNVDYIDNKSKLQIIANRILTNKSFLAVEARNLRAKISETGHIKAKYLTRDKDILKIKKGNFTACDVCKDGKRKTPEWSIGASKIEYDRKNIYLSNAFFKILNIPVLYFPKVIFPGPEVKKQSGFLPPKYKSDSLLGTQISTPIFFNLKSNFDITYTPTFLREENIKHDLETRFLSQNGQANMKLSYIKENRSLIEHLTSENITASTKKDKKWLIDYEHIFDFNKFSFETDIYDATDKGTLERYHSDYQQYYHSNINFNNIDKSHQYALNFNKYNNFTQNQNIYSTPQITIKKQNKLTKNINYDFEINSETIDNSANSNRDRIYFEDKTYRKFQSKNGTNYSLEFSNLVRAYNRDQANSEDGYINYVPLLALKINKKFYKIKNKNLSIIKPKLSILASSNSVNSNKISNIDSSTNFLNYNNIFENRKTSGIDILENGTRINYGLDNIWHFNKLKLKSNIAQSYYFESQDEISRLSGIKEEFSDIVGNFNINLKEKLNVNYQYKLKENNFKNYHNQISINADLNKAKISLNYLNDRFNQIEQSNSATEYLSANMRYLEKDKFSLKAYTTINLNDETKDPDSGPVLTGLNIELYRGCLTYIINATKNHISTANSDSGLQFTFNVKISSF